MGAFCAIKSKLNGNVIDIQKASMKPGTLLDAFPPKTTDNDNQLWEFIADVANPGYYFIKSKLSGDVIDIQENPNKTIGLLDAFPQKTTDHQNQLWGFVPDPAGSEYFFIRSQQSGFVIGIEHGSTKPGVGLDAHPQNLTGTDDQLWAPVGGKFPSPLLSRYTFGLDWFRINNTRSGNIFSTATDTDYVGFSLTVQNKPTKTLVKSMGNLSNGAYAVDLKFSNEEVSNHDKVVIAYHIVNSSKGEASATAYLQQTLGKLANAAAQALANDAAEDIGAAIGAAIGTAIPVPLLGSALGALGGWLVGDFWGVAFPNCDGPVAAGIHIYTGAELRRLTLEESGGDGKEYGSLERNPGVNSPSGCGSNSNYDVYWTVDSIS
jgi:Ricin-type beta-trefoil lectin domain-like